MRELILHMSMTVDGFIAKTDGSLWDAFPWPSEMQEFTNDVFRTVDTAVYGRYTYEAIVPWWTDVAEGRFPPDVEITQQEIALAEMIQSLKKIVVSRSIDEATVDATVIKEDIADNVRRLKEEPGANIILHAGAGLVAELAEADLIDSYMLFVTPAAIGVGKPLFSGVTRELPLELVGTKVFNSAVALLRYRTGNRP